MINCWLLALVVLSSYRTCVVDGKLMKSEKPYSIREWSKRELRGVLQDPFDPWEILETATTEWQKCDMAAPVDRTDMCLIIDDTLQICNSYTNEYHEIFVHFPIAYLEKIEHALIIGGGDALALNELLKYKSIKKIYQLELDEKVVELSEKYFGVDAHMDNPKVEWVFGDAFKTFQDLLDDPESPKFDLVVVDISETPKSNTVKGADFFDMLKKLTDPKGIIIKNEEYFKKMQDRFTSTLEVFYNGVPLLLHQMFALGCDECNLLVPNFKLIADNNVEMKFYEPFRAGFHQSLISGYHHQPRFHKTTERRNVRFCAAPAPETWRQALLQIVRYRDHCSEQLNKPYVTHEQVIAEELRNIGKRSRPAKRTGKAVSVKVRFINRSDGVLSVFWEGKHERRSLGELPAHTQQTFSSFVGHRFSLENLDKEIVRNITVTPHKKNELVDIVYPPQG